MDVFDGFYVLCGLAVLVHFEQVFSDLKGFRTILVKKLFRLKMFTLLETKITSKRFSVLFAFLKFLTAFGFVLFGRFDYVSDFLNDYF